MESPIGKSMGGELLPLSRLFCDMFPVPSPSRSQSGAPALPDYSDQTSSTLSRPIPRTVSGSGDSGTASVDNPRNQTAQPGLPGTLEKSSTQACPAQRSYIEEAPYPLPARLDHLGRQSAAPDRRDLIALEPIRSRAERLFHCIEHGSDTGDSQTDEICSLPTVEADTAAVIACRRQVHRGLRARQTSLETASQSGGGHAGRVQSPAPSPQSDQRPHLPYRKPHWAGFLTDWGGPAEGERPAAYVIILHDTEIREAGGVDHGIAAQSMVLGAMERGIGGCMIGSIDRPKLRAALEIPERYDILLIVALGKPAETVVLEDVGPDGDIKYYRDDQDVHHVPKRTLTELILSQYGG